MSNMELWNKIKSVPEEVKKPITGGRLKGMTDIKPQWRYQVMTDHFGVIGFGWYYEITNQWIENGGNEEKSAFTNINLYIKINDEWSKPITGTGGSSFVANEKHGLYTSDECFKMALTDALSVAMVKLGLGSDVYMGLGSKYTQLPANHPQKEPNKPELPWLNPGDEKWNSAIAKKTDLKVVLQYYRMSKANQETYKKQIQ